MSPLPEVLKLMAPVELITASSAMRMPPVPPDKVTAWLAREVSTALGAITSSSTALRFSVVWLERVPLPTTSRPDRAICEVV